MTDTQSYLVMLIPAAAIVTGIFIDAWQFAKLRGRLDAFTAHMDRLQGNWKHLGKEEAI